MTRAQKSVPAASVIIPTYNDAKKLASSLESLTVQSFPVERFEVIVADDGSRDSTAHVVNSFGNRLRLKYFFQEDQGMRAAAARNGGARQSSSPILIFLDTGTLAGPDFVHAHIRHHSKQRNAVVGYTYGYQPWGSGIELSRALSIMSPERVVALFSDEPWTWDWRHDKLVDPHLNVNDRDIPWLLFQSMNCSLRSADFWELGGFDPDIRHWGTEDLELGFRLRKAGIPFVVGLDAWALEPPERRDMEFRLNEVKLNAQYFLEKHPEPVSELFWLTLMNEGLWEVEADYETFLRWTKKARDISVKSEISELTKDVVGNPGFRITILGCGAELPASLPSCTLIEFDRTLLENIVAAGFHAVHHGIGLRTALADQSQDLVIITSRLSGLWERWGGQLTAEARRIGRHVRCVL